MGEGHGFPWQGRLSEPLQAALPAGRGPALWLSVGSNPLDPGAGGRLQTELAQLYKGTLRFFLENQQEEEANDARLRAHALGHCQWGGSRVGRQVPGFGIQALPHPRLVTMGKQEISSLLSFSVPL